LSTNFYKIVLLFTIFFFCKINAQPKTGEFINASIGFGISAPYDESDISGSGFYAQGEYVIGISKWFGVRPYVGIILTSEDKSENHQNQFNYKVTSKALLLGGKARIVAPIKYIAPYIETGFGLSVGSFDTYTPLTNRSKNGLIAHIPFSIGLALGKKNNFDIAFTYYYHPSVKQFSGAAAFGLTFPIKN
jgi:hypothetical protein